jgi:methylenetetrahydrofolate reductase (NADPH)
MAPNPPISELLARRIRPLRSLEFFPPKDEAAAEALRETAAALRALHPDFVSVTYGAGGSTRERTAQVSALLKSEFHFTVMPHLTCVGHSCEELRAIAGRIHAEGFRNVMVLRGDPPRGAAGFTPVPGGLRYASELVALVKDHRPDLCLGVAGYPEKHPEAASPASDLENLKRKVEAGGDFVTTQLFFDNDVYFRFVERCRNAGIEVPIIPGIMPVLSFNQILRFTSLCGASLPARLYRRLESASNDPVAVEAIGIEWAQDQIRALLAGGAPGYHLYILNRAKSALALAEALS